MKPERIFTATIMGIGFLIALLFFLFASLFSECKAQSIGTGLQVSNDTTTQYIFSATEIYQCWGFYGTILTKEDPKSDYTNDNSDIENNGFSFGINYTFLNGHFRYLSAGTGYYNQCIVDKYGDKLGCSNNRSWFFEGDAAIMVTRWLDITFGFNTMPMIMSGIQFRLNFSNN